MNKNEPKQIDFVLSRMKIGSSKKLHFKYKHSVIALKSFYSILICLVYSSCLSKQDRNTKKEARNWRSSKVVLWAYHDTPLYGSTIILRDNRKFEHSTSGFFKSFETGNWSISNDSLILNYLNFNSEQEDQIILIFTNNDGYLTHHGASPILYGYKILDQKLRN